MKQAAWFFISFTIVFFSGKALSAEQNTNSKSYKREALRQKQQAKRQFRTFSRYEGRRDKRYEGTLSIWIGSEEAFEERTALEEENEQLWSEFKQLVEENSQIWQEIKYIMPKEKNLFDLAFMEELKITGRQASHLVDSLKSLYRQWESSRHTLKLNGILEEENRIISEYNSLIEQENELVILDLPIIESSLSSVASM